MQSHVRANVIRWNKLAYRRALKQGRLDDAARYQANAESLGG